MDLKRRLARALGGRAGRAGRAAERGYRPAAVLVPILAGNPRLLFIERAAYEGDPHSGQIGFPGGRWEPGDPDAAATALREAEEELGLPPDAVQVLGQLEQTLTPSGYCITPVVGWIPQPPKLAPDAREVAGCFEVDLGELAAPGCRFPRGEHFEYRAGGRVIWGATARIVSCLLSLSTIQD